MTTRILRRIDPKWRPVNEAMAVQYFQEGLAKLPLLFGISAMDDGRIVDYVVYQLYRSRSAVAEGRWRYTWLFSQNALDKYRKQFIDEDGKSGVNYYIDQWLGEAELPRRLLAEMIADPKEHPLWKMVHLVSEEPIKRRFLNTADGLALCQCATTGWSPLSETCGQCDNWVECGKMTARKYPELMRLRKEVYHGRKEK